jgi:hypothetical protein
LLQSTSYTGIVEMFGDGSMIVGNVVLDTLSIASLSVPQQSFLALYEEQPQSGNTYFDYPADGIFVSSPILMSHPGHL